MRRDRKVVTRRAATHDDAEGMSRLKRRAALASIVASVVVTLAKLAAAALSGSLALLADAAHSLVDVAATTATYFAIRAAEKPADDEHHYGHGKIESVAALGEAALLFALAGVALVEAARRLFSGVGSEIEPSIFVFAVLAFSICIDAARWRALTIVARDTGSDALAADALHFLADLASSIVVIVALAAAMFGYARADAVAAIIVSLFIAHAAFALARRTLAVLLDAAPRGAAEAVRDAALATPGVLDVEWTRVRPSGSGLFCEIGVGVARMLPLERVLEIRREIAARIVATLPGVSVTATASPRTLDDESVLERVLLIAARRRVPVHHVLAQRVAGRMCVSFDVEIDRRMSLGAAHAIASRLEEAVRAELGPDIEVESHIEPLDAAPIEGEEAQPARVTVVRDALETAARIAGCGVIHDIHTVRVRRSDRGEIVHFHCYADAAIDVGSAHALVDAIEREAASALPEAIRIVGHVEPPRVDKDRGG